MKTVLRKQNDTTTVKSAAPFFSRTSSAQPFFSPVASVSKQSTVNQLQREDKKGGAKTDIDFKLMPPELKLTLWDLILKASTSSADLTFKLDDFSTNLKYSYGGALTLGGKYGGFGASAGYTPGGSSLSLGASYGGFKLSGSADWGKSSYGLGLSYGAPLLPFPGDIGKAVTAGEKGLEGVASAIPEVMSPNPYTWYQAQKPNIDAASKAYDVLKNVADGKKGGIDFGAGIRLNYDPQNKLFVWGGVQGSF